MNIVAYKLIVAPPHFWGIGSDVISPAAPFIRDALAIERRIAKGVNLDNERLRYFLCCRRIQEEARRLPEYGSACVLSEGYLSLLHALPVDELVSKRFAACFHPPDTVEQQIQNFERAIKIAEIQEHPDARERIKTLKRALERKCGLVETMEFLSPHQSPSRIIFAPRMSAPVGTYIQTGNWEELSDDAERKDLLEVFCRTIEEAIGNGLPVNFSNQPHSIIAEALHRFVYRPSPEIHATSIRVIYMDGSEAKPFPVRCLDPIDAPQTGPVERLKVSLISMRHLEMDEHVDIAWFRNRRVSAPRPFAETDAYCAEETQRMLADFATRTLRLDLYQTGLETAVIGFYRGLVETLLRLRSKPDFGSLAAVPYYFNKRTSEYVEGSHWS